MEVTVIDEATSPDPEVAVALAARNDYYAGNITEDSFEEVMAGIDGDTLDDRMHTLLVDRLLRHEHFGPFEHPQIMFHIEGMSRVTMAQVTRHRHLSFDIQSMRYVDFGDADVAIPASLTDPDHFSRETGSVELDDRTRARMHGVFVRQVESAVDAYHEMVENGIPKEDARYILPLGAKVNVVMSGNLRTMLHVMNMRGKANAQWEIRDLTKAVVDELHNWAPITAEYFEENGPFRLGM